MSPPTLDARTVAELLQQTGALAIHFQRAGFAAGAGGVLTLLGTVFGLRSRILRAFAALTMLAVLALLGTGAYGTYNGYKAADAAVATVTPPSAAERQKRAA